MIANNSSLRDYEKCPRKFYHSRIANLWSGHYNENREEGSIFHALLAAWYTDRDTELVKEVLDAEYAPLLADTAFQEQTEHFLERRDYLWRLFLAYAEHYKDEDFVVVDTETSFITSLGDSCYGCQRLYPEEATRGFKLIGSCDCKEPIHYLVGRADMLILENGLLKLVDHKTKKSSAGESYMAQFEESSQFTQYMYGVSRCSGRPVSLGIANVIVKLKLIAERGVPFHRNEEIVKTSVDFHIFEQDRLMLIDEIERDKAKLTPEGIPTAPCFRRNTNACRDFGKCPYYALCNPARHNWWEIPEGVEMERREKDYVDDYMNLIEEEVS